MSSNSSDQLMTTSGMTMANIELTFTAASIRSAPVGQSKAPTHVSSGPDTVVFKDLLQADMLVEDEETQASLSEIASISPASLTKSESVSAKKPTPVNMQTALDEVQADQEDGSEVAAMMVNFAVFSDLQDNPVDSSVGSQKAPPSQTLSPLSPPQSTPESLAITQTVLGANEVIDEAKAPSATAAPPTSASTSPLVSASKNSIHSLSLTAPPHDDELPYGPDVMSEVADNKGHVLPFKVSNLPSDGKPVSEGLSHGLIMTKLQDMKQSPAVAISDVSINELHGAKDNSGSMDFSVTLTGADESIAPSNKHPFAAVAAVLTTERTRARMDSSSTATLSAAVSNAIQNTEGPPAMSAASPVNLPDTLSLDTQPPIQVQESAEFAEDVIRATIELSPETGVDDAEQTFAERINPISNTPGRTFTTTNASVPNARLDMPLALQQGNWEKPIGQQLLWMAQHQTQQAEIRVDPPHLGPIEVHLSLKDDQAKVNFFSHDAAVRETLENTLPKLRDLFDSQGMQLNQANVSDQSLARQQSESGNQSLRQGNASRGEIEGGASDNDELESDFASQTPEQGNGTVDHYV
jgi:flagellar hook-length control protein FliK